MSRNNSTSECAVNRERTKKNLLGNFQYCYLMLCCLFLLNCNDTKFSQDTKKQDPQSQSATDNTPYNPDHPAFNNGDQTEKSRNDNDQSSDGETSTAENKTSTTNDDGSVSERWFGISSNVEGNVEVDVIFAMDTSGSMRDEMQKIEQNMATFLETFTKQDWVDAQIFMIGGATNPNIAGEVTFGFNFPVLDANTFDDAPALGERGHYCLAF